MRAALFDLDRTLRKDSATLYVRYQREIGEVGKRDVARVFWWLLQYTFGVLDVHAVAARAIGTLAGQAERDMIERCDTDW